MWLESFQVLLQLADDFIEGAVSASCGLAKHRKSGVLEVKDLSVYLESAWNMTIPGFSGEPAPGRKATGTEAHKQVGVYVKYINNPSLPPPLHTPFRE